MARPAVHQRLRDFALSLPGAWEDHPWGDAVVKAGKKIFVFLGDEEHSGLTVKLPDSNGQALMLPGAEPTGYGLGKAGWVSIPLRGKLPPFGVLSDFVEESYRAVAPRTLVKELDARRVQS